MAWVVAHVVKRVMCLGIMAWHTSRVLALRHGGTRHGTGASVTCLGMGCGTMVRVVAHILAWAMARIMCLSTGRGTMVEVMACALARVSSGKSRVVAPWHYGMGWDTRHVFWLGSWHT